MSDQNNLSADDRATFSVLGMIRFDAQAVAQALRSRPLSILEAHSLADLLEGKNIEGLRLVMQGQGKGWKPISEGAAAYERIITIGKYIDAQLAAGTNTEDAVLDAAEEFRISEATVYRDLRLYRLRDE